MRPVVEALRARGAEVEVTARDFAQTVGLAERFGLDAEVDRPPPRRARRGEGGRARVACDARSRAGRARRGRFDLALGHGSNDVTVAAALLRIPRSTMFDYEWAAVQHTINCRLAQAVVVPDAIPPGAPGPLRRPRQAASATRGSRRSTTSPDFAPDTAVLDELGLDPAQPIAVVRTPPERVAVPPLRALAVRRRARPPARPGPGRRPAADARAAGRARAGGRLHASPSARSTRSRSSRSPTSS